MKRLDIAVAGCGPAGLAAALALHRQGHRIKLFEQFAVPKPLGSGLILQPTGLAVLDSLGLGARMHSLGARIDRLYGKAFGSDRVVLDVRYEALGEARGLAVHRAGLFNVLYDAVTACSIEIQTNNQIVGLKETSLVIAGKGVIGPFDLVVDALGSRSPLIPCAVRPDYRARLNYGAIWASLPWPGAPFHPHALEQRYDKASVMIGVLPIGRQRSGEAPQAAFFWSLKIKDFPAWQREGLEVWKTRVCNYWPEAAPLLDGITSPNHLTLASYDHHTLPLPYGERLVFVGDSAHSTSPQLGQGANMALLDVHALACAFETHDDLPDALAAYARARQFNVRLYQMLSRMFTPFYQSDSRTLAFMRDQLVAPLSRVPGVSWLLARLVAGQLGHPL